MFSAALVLGHRDDVDTIAVMLRDLAEGLAAQGLEVRHLVAGRDPDAAAAEFMRGRAAFAVDVNGRIGFGDGWKFSLVVDHPLAHPQLGKAHPRTVLGLIDAGHAAIGGYTAAGTAFVPHGGPPPIGGQGRDGRDIDVLFIGHIGPMHTAANRFEDMALAAGRRVAEAAADPALGLIGLLGENGIGLPQLNPTDFAHLLGIASNEAQRLARIAAVGGIRGCHFAFAGFLTAEMQARLAPECRYLGSGLGFGDCCALMRRARVVVNVSQKFPHGSHERIWYAMANGAAVITNRSSFVEQTFAHRRDILFYDHPAQVGDLVRQALDGDTDRRLAAAAAAVQAAHHTWSERAERIVAAMNRRAAGYSG